MPMEPAAFAPSMVAPLQSTVVSLPPSMQMPDALPESVVIVFPVMLSLCALFVMCVPLPSVKEVLMVLFWIRPSVAPL